MKDNLEEFTRLLQKELISTFKFTVDFLEENNYNWCTCGGTTLGAIRHNNIIPWDDDIDIYMPRADYDRLINDKSALKGTGYEIVCLEHTPDYHAPFAKLIKTNSSWQEREFLTINTGVYVDIFPLDYFDCDDDTIVQYQISNKELERKYYYSIVRCRLSYILHSLETKNYKEIGVMLKGLMYPRFMKNYWLRKYLDRQEFYKAQSGSKSVCVTQWRGRVFQKVWFEDLISVPFDDFSVKVPREYDKYLTLLYGDYMKLPPVEKRVTHHHQYYINLSKRLTPGQIKERVKKGLKFEV